MSTQSRAVSVRLALALCGLASLVSADPQPRALDIRLFHAATPAIEAAGISLTDLVSEANPRHWSVRVIERDEWAAIIKRLADGADTMTVHEVAIPGAAEGIVVTRELPWQLDGTVQLPVTSPGAEGQGSAMSIVELPLRIACWIEGKKDDVKVEALIPTGRANAGGSIPLATRVELEVGAKPVLAVAVSCENGACEANVLAVQPREP